MEVIDRSEYANATRSKDGKTTRPVPIMFYKTYLVKQYLQFTDWLVWQDFDLIVKNPHNWFEQYLAEHGDDRFHLLLTDLSDNINNGAFMLRNSAWGQRFVDHWLFLCSNRNRYIFTDNGPFAEAVLRFSSHSLPEHCGHYEFDSCLQEMAAAQKSATYRKGVLKGPKSQGRGAGGRAFVNCLGKYKERMMGPWNRKRHRAMGRVRFVATAEGFNVHGWGQWKGGSGGTKNANRGKGANEPVSVISNQRGDFFVDSMFVLHNKDFDIRVPPSSIDCPLVQQQSIQGHGAEASSRPTLIPIDDMVKREGAYMMSAEIGGFCDMDHEACQRAHFPACHPGSIATAKSSRAKKLRPISRTGIKERKELLVTQKSPMGSSPVPPIAREPLINVRGRQGCTGAQVDPPRAAGG